MVFFKQLPLLAALSLQAANGSIYTISDDRVRSMDITPVLGRGYSIMTDKYHATCLMVSDLNVPSYNYDYFFEDMSTSSDRESSMSGQLSTSLSYGKVKFEAGFSASSESKVSTQSRMITSTMKIERYYNSVKEQTTPLSPDAKTLLDSEDYVGFFKACGPNYVRGIRRAQEVTAIFKFTSSDVSSSRSFASNLKVEIMGNGGGFSMASKSKFKQVTSSLQIKIIGFGLGLSQEGSETMVATSLNEYNEVMRFAFNTMTKSTDAMNIGMIYGIEVVPWVHNTAFQVAAKLQDENIILPLPRSLIPKATHNVTGVTTGFTNDDTGRTNYRCKDPSFEIDKYGYCCERDALFDLDTTTFGYENVETKVCRPQRQLDRALLKDNMVNNAEFVSRLDSTMRYKLVQISQLEKCVSAANSFPSRFDFRIIKSQDTVKYDRALDTTGEMTLFDLKRAIDPLGDFTLIRHLARELDEWIQMYYSPCMAALYGTNIATSPETDVSFFMAYPWHTHSECMHLSCLSVNMRWNRKDGGCVPSMITGSSLAESYVDGEDTHCHTDDEQNDGDEEACKFDQGELGRYHTEVTTCWDSVDILGGGQIDYFISHFCLPQLTENSVSEEVEAAKIQSAVDNCGYVAP